MNISPSSLDVPATLATALAGRYVVTRELGRGGMATVFLADDLKHQRQVAIKVLLPELGAVLGAERFLSEIRVTANLQHPNLLPLFDSGDANGLLYYVMPYVEGETLRARLDREQQLPVEEAVRLSRTMAGALDYAHQRGVIHRDLKPENVLLQAGQPVIADFGIALAVAQAGGQRITQTGLSLGTPQYMSPEQATGDKQLDGRTDIYALGAMTYEMLTGEPPHVGNSAQAIIAKLMTEEVRSLTVLRRSVPANVDTAVRRALEKLPADRFATAEAFAMALGDGTASSERHTTPMRRNTARIIASLATFAAAMTFVAAWSVWHVRTNVMSGLPVQRFELLLPDSILANPGFGYAGAMSPDGRRILITAAGFGRGQQSFLRRTDQLELEPFADGAEIQEPVFALDGESVFYLDSKSQHLRRYRLRERRSETLAPLSVSSLGMDVTDDNRIIASAVDSAHPGLSVISVTGGDWKTLTKVDSTSEQHNWPVVLPGTQRVLFAITNEATTRSELAIADLTTGAITHLGIAGVRPLAMIDGYVIYVRADGELMATMPSTRAAATPSPVRLGISASSVGPGGLTAFAIGRSGALLQMVERIEFRGGEMLPNGISHATGPFFDVRLGIWVPSPDGRTLAYTPAGGQYEGSLTLAEIGTGRKIGQTKSTHVTGMVWDKDGTSLILSVRGIGNRTAIVRETPGSLTPPDTLGTVDGQELAIIGRFLGEDFLASNNDFTARDADVLVLRKTGPRTWTSVPFVATPANEVLPALSPDGRWVAWQTDAGGYSTIAVRPASDAGPMIAISRDTTIGTFPAWSADSRAIFLTEHTGRLHKVSLTFEGNRPRVVSDVIIPNLAPGAVERPGSADLLDGDRFIPLRAQPDGREAGIYARSSRGRYVYVPNWIDELRAKLDAARGGK